MKKSAIILAAIMLLSSFEPVVATEKPTTENKKINWLLENDFVAGRGQAKDLKLEDTITRAEFTRMILVIKGEENLAKEDLTSKADFKDVPNTHWAEKFIVYAKQKGYISGYPDGNFRPEGEITYEEMISILARIHPNYRKIEAKSTNWAEGFINFAKDNGILDDINIKGSYKSPAIREKTFEMTYNFIKFVENQTKSEKVSKIKEEKDVKKENSTWNGFYPYWIGYGFRPIVEEKPEVKPNPDVKPVPDKHEEPGTPEKENPSEPGTQPETPGEENPTEPEAPKEFDKTKIDKVEIVNKPSKLEYTEGEKLDLSGIKLKLTDTQGIVNEIGLEHFEEYGIITEPSVGASLTTNENGTTIKIKLHGEVKVETDLLIVNQKVFDPENLKTITVKTQPTKLSYTEGEKLNLAGLEITFTDNQGLTKDIAFKDFAANGITAEPANDTALTLTDNEKKVKLTKGNLTAETEALTVKEKVFDPAHVEKMVVKTQPTKLVYTDGEKLNLAGLEVTLTDNQGLTKDVAFADFGKYKITAKPANDTALTLTDNEKKVKLIKGNLTAETEVLTVKEKVFDSAHVESMGVKTQPTKLNYTEGEKLALAGLVVTLTDNQGLTKNVAFKDFTDNGITTTPANDTALAVADNAKKVKLTKGSLTAQTNPLTVNPKVFDPAHVEKMEVKEQPTKLVYTEGEKLNLSGLEVTLTDNQGLTKDVAFKDFATNGITAEPANETALTLAINGKKVTLTKGSLTAEPANDTALTLAINGKKVTLTKGSLTAETEALTVKEKVFDPEHVEKMEVKEQPTKLNYTEGEKLALSGLEVTLTDNQGLTKNVAFKDFTDNGITTTPANDTALAVADNAKKVKLTKGSLTAQTNPLTVNPEVFDPEHVEKMVVKTQPTKLVYTDGEKLNLAGLEVTLTDNQGLTKDVVFTDFGKYNITAEPTNETSLTLANNEKKVTLTKGNLTAQTNALTVLEKVVGPKDPTKPDGKNPDANKYWTVKFESADTSKGTVAAENTFYILKTAGKTLADLKDSAPAATAIGNNKFDGWEPALDTNTAIDQDRTIKAQFSAKVFDPEHVENIEVKTHIKNSLVEVYKSLGDIKLGIDNLHNKYYLLFTKESNKIAIEKNNLKTSILNTIKNNKIKSYTIGETNRELLDGENYKSDETILGFIREDILKLAGLEGNPSATDAQILEKLEVTKPNSNIKLVVGDEHIELNYEIIFLSQMTEDKVNQIEADFIKHMEETSLAVQKEDKGFQVSYKDKEYKVLIKPAYKFYDMQELADKCGYDRVLINFFTGENLDTAKSLKNLKSLKIYNKNRYDRISNVVMDSLELKTLLVGKKDFRERTKIYHETFRKPNRGIFAEDLAPGTIRLEYFYTDESSKTGSIITRNIFYKIIN